MLGGSSNINYLLYVRGDAKDFDHWADLGFLEWSYEKVLPYFLKSEKYLDQAPNDEINHNRNGELPVRDSIYLSPLAKAWQKMAEKHHLNQSDINDGDLRGFAVPQLNLDSQGRRGDTYSSFLKHILHTRKNLQVVTGARVYRVLLDDEKVTRGNLIPGMTHENDFSLLFLIILPRC